MQLNLTLFNTTRSNVTNALPSQVAVFVLHLHLSHPLQMPQLTRYGFIL